MRRPWPTGGVAPQEKKIYWQGVLKEEDVEQVGHKTRDTCIGTLLHLATVARHFLSGGFNL
jgi:hypothetical protein